MDVSGSQMIATALGNGIAVGLLTMLGITILFLPASWIMNRFVYHTTLMRVLLGAATAHSMGLGFAVVLFGCLMGSFKKVHYFGLFPTFLSAAAEPVGWMGPLLRLWNVVTHPFRINMDGGQADVDALKATIEQFLVPTDAAESQDTDAGVADVLRSLSGEETGPKIYKKAVCEPFYAAARAAGALKDDDQWVATMKALEETGVGQYQMS